MQRLALPLAFLSVILTAIILWGGLSQEQPKNARSDKSVLSPYKTGAMMPQVTVSDSDGRTFKISELLGDKTLLTIWSSKCNICREGLLAIERVAAADGGIKNVLVNLGDEPQDAKTILKSYGVKLDTYYDRDGSLYRAFAATMPSSYFIERGVIVYFFPGRITSELLTALLEDAAAVDERK